MFPTATIVFREILEIALVISIVMAAIRELPSKYTILWAGLASGLAGSILIAFFTDRISASIDGMGQEIFNACIMFTAVGFLSWTVIWMKHHARELQHRIRHVGDNVTKGHSSGFALVSIIALATFREGTEIVLFTHGMLASHAFTIGDIILGGAIGTVGGVVIGAMLYLGLLKTVKRHLFTVTSWLLILLTAGMAAQGASFLVSADVLPALLPQVWDSSHIISASSILGQTLGILIGYTPRPTGIELIFYLSVVGCVGMLYTYTRYPQRSIFYPYPK